MQVQTGQQPLAETLYYRAGTSDKVYQAELMAKDGGWVVQFAYGRRGSALRPGLKTPQPIAYDEAAAVYRALLTEKRAGGYLPGEAGAAIVEAGGSTADSGFFRAPQLVAETPGAAVPELLLVSEAWTMQEKFDGERFQLHRQEDNVFGFSKLGRLRAALPEALVYAVRRVRPWTDFILDGELLGDGLRVFDVLSYGGREVTGEPYKFRYGAYNTMVGALFNTALQPVEGWIREEDKRRELARIRRERGEGVVFKRLNAPYQAGKNSDNAVKFKFVAAASVIVSGHTTGKHSFEMALFDGTRLGRCTVAASVALPPVGTIAEVQYLYLVGSLVQAVYLGAREDVLPEECVAAQLKARQER